MNEHELVFPTKEYQKNPYGTKCINLFMGYVFVHILRPSILIWRPDILFSVLNKIPKPKFKYTKHKELIGT